MLHCMVDSHAFGCGSFARGQPQRVPPGSRAEQEQHSDSPIPAACPDPLQTRPCSVRTALRKGAASQI